MAEQNNGKVYIVVVDDEPIIADELGELLQRSLADEGAVVQVAYNAAKVLQLLASSPCDILISDIQMPGMTGLKLVEKLHQENFNPHVIFLTGYDDFAFAHEAFRQKADHYLLKTEGDETIVATIREFFEKVRSRRAMEARIQEASERYQQAVPAYRRHLLTRVLLDDLDDCSAQELDELFPGHFFVMVAQAESSGQRNDMRTKLIVQSAIEKIVSDALGDNLKWTDSTNLDREWIWIFAMREQESSSGMLFELSRKARHRLEESLSMQLFFLVADEPTCIHGLSETFQKMRRILSQEILQESTGVALRRVYSSPVVDQDELQRIGMLRKQVENCVKELKEGRINSLMDQAAPVLDYLQEEGEESSGIKMEFFHTLYGSMLTYIHQNGIAYEAGADTQSMASQLRSMICLLGEKSQEQMANVLRSTTQFILDYIRMHISEDVSTAALSKASGYSSGYLSRIFKQQQGISIHDYVTMARMQLAREFLCNSNLKIYEIAASCGYDSTAYFIKVFKNNTGMTPQEYKQEMQQPGQKPPRLTV